jgi:multicomponent Na+:H+ antiporter subunit D
VTAAEIAASAPLWLAEHGVVLAIAAPLLAAAIAAMTPSPRGAWAIAFAVTVFCAGVSGQLLAEVWTSGPISYPIGGFLPPVGIEYRVDALNGAMLFLVSVMGALCALYAPSSVAAEIPQSKQALFYSAFLVCFAGLLGVAVTGDAFNLFVFLEISSLSTYVLVAMGWRRDRRALTASYNYLILGTIGATFYVIGVGFLYMATGTLNFADLAVRLAPQADTSTVRAGFAFIVIGLGLKLAMFPLHTWLPNAYAFAPSFVTVFLASTATKVAFYALVRFLYSVFDPTFAFHGTSLVVLLAPLALAAMLIASFQAVFQDDVRRLFAYSSVAQIGYMLTGLAFGSGVGLAAGLLHLFNHAMMKGALFMALGALSMRLGATRVEQFRGLGRVMPFTMGALVVGGLSLIGVPFTAGFISKWYLLDAALARGWWWTVAVIAVASVLAFIYVGRILEAAYLRPPPTHEGRVVAVRPLPLGMSISLWALVVANIWFGVDASFTSQAACRAAEAVMVAGDACNLLGSAR